jgi:hypothetical protein
VVWTDLFQRGVPWMLLMLRAGVVESDLNVSWPQRASVAATGLGIVGLLASPLYPPAALLLVFNVLVQLVCNLGFYNFLARRKGYSFAARSLPLHHLYFCCCGLSVVIAVGLSALLPRSERAAAVTRLPRTMRVDVPSRSRPIRARLRRLARWIGR